MNDLELINEETGNSYKIEKAVFVGNEKNRFDNGGFFTAFSSAFEEIAGNRKLKTLDKSLLFLILSYMGRKEMMPFPNVQKLLGVEDYAKGLGYKSKSKGHVSTAFQRLERLGLIKRDKKNKNLTILINPDLAYNGKIRKFPHVWNQLALDFGLEPKVGLKKENGGQDWDSHLLNDLKTKSNER